MNSDTISTHPISILKPPSLVASKNDDTISMQRAKISIDERLNETYSTITTKNRTYSTDKELRKANFWGVRHITLNRCLSLLNDETKNLILQLQKEENSDNEDDSEEDLERETRLPPNYTIGDIKHLSQWPLALKKIQYDAGFTSKHEITDRLNRLETINQEKHEMSERKRANHALEANLKLQARTVQIPRTTSFENSLELKRKSPPIDLAPTSKKIRPLADGENNYDL